MPACRAWAGLDLGAARDTRRNDGVLSAQYGSYCRLTPVRQDDRVEILGHREQTEETVMSWLGKLQEAKAEIAKPNVDPWRLPLERVRGKIDFDGIERVTTQMLLDVLEVPQRK